MEGWSVGFGNDNSYHLNKALRFYEFVLSSKNTARSVYEDAPANVVLVGHSLGGGLAQTIAAMTGAEAYIYDNMPGIEAAKTLLENHDPNLQVDLSGIEAISLQGEVLENIRSGYYHEVGVAAIGLGAGFVGAFAATFPIVAATIGGAGIAAAAKNSEVVKLLAPFLAEALITDPLGIKARNSEQLIDDLGNRSVLSNFGTYDSEAPLDYIRADAKVIDYHSQALLVTRIYGEDIADAEQGVAWRGVAASFYKHLNSNEAANKVNILWGGQNGRAKYEQGNDDEINAGQATGNSEIGSQMGTSIAYTAMPGSSPFGTVAMAAMYNDAVDLGEASNDAVGGLMPWQWLQDNLDEIGEMIVVNAGYQAYSGNNSSSLKSGVLEYYQGHLKVSGGTAYNELFLQSVIGPEGSFWEGKAIQNIYLIADGQNVSLSHSLGMQVVVATGEGITATGTTDDEIFYAIADGVTFSGIGGNDVYVLKDGHNTVHTGAGSDEVTGGVWHDTFYGSIGTDIFFGRGGKDTLTFENVNHGVVIGQERTTSSGGVDSSYIGVEIIRGTDHGDKFNISIGEVGVFEGLGGDDVFDMDAASRDTQSFLIRGGDDLDTANYSDDIRFVSMKHKTDGGVIIQITSDGGKTFNYDTFYDVELINFASTGQTIDTRVPLQNGFMFDPDLFAETMLVRDISGRPSFMLDGYEWYYRPYSPLILDMDGDGVESISLISSAVQFDMNLDGHAEHTAWVSPDDALLAFDRNGNGKIDDSSELFGGQTQNGFVTLAILDTNADGIIDAQDADYANLVLWQDLNSDGRTDPGELVGLTDAGIASISLAAVTINETNNGNPVTHRSTFTRTDGSAGNIDDVWFVPELAFSYDIGLDGWSPNIDQIAAPTLVNYGTGDNFLHSVSQRPDMAAALQNTIDIALTGDMMSFRTSFEALVMEWLLVDPTPVKRGYGVWHERAHEDVLLTLHAEMPDYMQYSPTRGRSETLEKEYQHAIDSMAGKFLVQVLSTNMGETSLDTVLSSFSGLAMSYRNDAMEGDTVAAGRAALQQLPGQDIQDVGLVLRFISQNIPANERQTWWEMISVDIELTETQYHLARAFVMSESINDSSQDAGYTWNATVLDTLHLGTGASETFGSTGKETFLPGAGDDTIRSGDGNDVYIYRLGDGHDIFDHGNRNDGQDKIILSDGISPDMVKATPTDDGKSLKLTIGDGSITLLGYFERDIKATIVFNDGTIYDHASAVSIHAMSSDIDDTIVGGRFADILHGYEGNDQIHGNLGNDRIIGGEGDDLIHGGAGADVYVYDLGDGNDIVNTTGDSIGLDAIEFGAGIGRQDVTISRTRDGDLHVYLAQGGSITIPRGFSHQSNQLAEIRFADGQVMTRAKILDATLTGGHDNDYILAPNKSSTLTGNDGNDEMIGSSFSDVLDGGNGDDVIHGRGGANVIDAGAGNDTIHVESMGDTLTGGAGFDVFMFLSGLTGQNHTITDYEAGIDEIDLSAIGDILELQNGSGLNWLGDDAFTNTAGQIRNGNNGLEIDIDGDGLMDISIATPVPVQIDDLFL